MQAHIKREHNTVLQEKERRIQELERNAIQKGSPLATLQDKLKQAESALQTRDRETDLQTITHLSEMENELSEAYEQKDQFELKLKTQSAELMALRERHQAAMSNSLQLERNATSLHDEIAALKDRLAQAEKQRQPERAVQPSSTQQQVASPQTATTPRRHPEIPLQSSPLPRQAPSTENAARRQVETAVQSSPVQSSPQQAPPAKSSGLFKSGSLLRKKKSQPRDADSSNLGIAPDQFEQYVSARPSMDSSRPSMDMRPSMDSIRSSMDTIRPDQASIGSSSGTVRRKSSLMQRFRHSIRRSSDNLALDSPSASTSSIVSQSDVSPAASDRRRSVDMQQTRSDIPRPTNRLATIPSGNILTQTTVGGDVPTTEVGTSYTRPSSRNENARPASRNSQISRLPQPEGGIRRSSAATVDLTASSSLPVPSAPNTPTRPTNSSTRPTSPPPASPLLALRKPAEERDKERYQPHTPHSRIPSGTSPKTTNFNPPVAQQPSMLERTVSSSTSHTMSTISDYASTTSPTIETPSERTQIEFAVAATPTEVDVHGHGHGQGSPMGLAQAASTISPGGSSSTGSPGTQRKSLDRAKERRELSLAERQSLRMNGGK